MNEDIDLAALSRRYGRQFTSVSLVVDGVNRTYRISAGQDFFYLRLYAFTGDQTAISLLRYSFWSSSRCCRMLPSHGRSHHCTALTYSCWIFRENAGAHVCLLVDARELIVSLQDMALFGIGLGKLHAAFLSGSIPPGRVIAPMSICSESIEVLRSFQLGEILAQMIEADCRPVLESVDQLDLPRGICHGDAWMANARISGDKIAFFDFDDCGVGPLMIDLGTQAWHLMNDDDVDADAMLLSLLAGYDTVRTLRADERAVLPTFIALAEIRSLLFLAKYCRLTKEMWGAIALRATKTLSICGGNSDGCCRNGSTDLEKFQTR